MYRAEKVLQEIICLLGMNGGRMNLLKLMKELYLADRESINERDTSISGDTFCSMPHGPVLSQSLNMCNDIARNNWSSYLKSEPTKYYPDIVLKKGVNIELDLLSQKDIEYLRKISEQFKDYNEFQIEDFTHTLKEWVDPKGSSFKIRFYDIMTALGKSDNEILEAKREYDQLETFNALGC